jgi:hypothetical protein
MCPCLRLLIRYATGMWAPDEGGVAQTTIVTRLLCSNRVQEVKLEGQLRQKELAVAVAEWIRPQLRSAFADWALLMQAAFETRNIVAVIAGKWQTRVLFNSLQAWKV